MMNSGILVVGVHLRGEIGDITYEMLGMGRRLADTLQTHLSAVLIGKDVTPLAAGLGMADRVYVLEHAEPEMVSSDLTASLLGTLMENNGFSLVLLGGTNAMVGVGARLSARSKIPFVNFCRNVRVGNGNLVATCQLYGGKILADLCLRNDRCIIGVCLGSCRAEEGKREGAPSVEPVSVSASDPQVSFRRYIEPPAGDVDITKQNVLIAVGRGIQNQDNIQMAEQLAAVLGGAVCASRPVVDQGWLPLTRQVGKSGMSVRPRLYLAAGISGAPEHEEGMKDSGLIVAINSDPNAPIFNIAHFGVCADALEILPALAGEISKRKERG